MNAERVMEMDQQNVMRTYGRVPIVFEKALGARVWDKEGKEYLDFFAGIAVNGVGHCHPRVVEAVCRQAATLMHCSNVYYHAPGAELAARISELTGGMKVFFANSGAEANEGAIKLARFYARRVLQQERFEVVTTLKSFHGRTLATLAATGQPKFHQELQPLPPGFRHVPFGDVAALAEAVGPQTAAVLVEPIQGEGGINMPPDGYLADVRRIANQAGCLLILDEVQTGMGRTGSFLAHQQDGVAADIVTLAKALASGLPMGAFLARPDVAEALKPGDHGSTFGGNPVVAAAALAGINVLFEEGLLENAARVGNYLQQGLKELATAHPTVREVRGRGLMLGMELSAGAPAVVDECRQRGLLINCTAGNVLRFLPPLIITESDVEQALRILHEALTKVEAQLPIA
jgi:acetylornithine/N-succinyldiaminopimelate aminotransferase